MAGFITRDSWSQFNGLHAWFRGRCDECGAVQGDAPLRCPGPAKAEG